MVCADYTQSEVADRCTDEMRRMGQPYPLQVGMLREFVQKQAKVNGS